MTKPRPAGALIDQQDDQQDIDDLHAMGGTAYLPLHELIPRIAADIGVVSKDRKSQGYGDSYAYQGIDDIIAKAKPVLHRYGVFYYPEHLSTVAEPVTSRGGAHGVRIRARYRWHWIGPAGDQLPTAPVVEGEAIDYGDKAMRKVQTSSKKAMLIDMLAIAADEAHDTDASQPGSLAPPARPTGPTEKAANAVKAKVYALCHELDPDVAVKTLKVRAAAQYAQLVSDSDIDDPDVMTPEQAEHLIALLEDQGLSPVKEVAE